MAATASPTPGPSALVLPDTPIEAVLDEAFDSSGTAFEPAVVGGLEPGDVTARWYVDDDRWVVHFEGLEPRETGPLCPGSSILTEFGFEHVSNAPTEPDACALFQSTLATPPVGVRLCAGEVLYLTEIPAATRGTLVGTVEQARSDGAVHGITSRTESTAGQPPRIDLDALGCETVEG